MSKVQSGTFGVIYEVLGADPTHMKLAPILECLQHAPALKITDLWPSNDSCQAYHTQSIVNIVKVLSRYASGFSHLQNDPELQHKPRRPLPPNYQTKFYPLQASTIEEAFVQGNLLVHDDIYLIQLKCRPEDLNEPAIPAIHDQLMNARNWGAQVMQKKDVTPWSRCEIFQLGFGVFHLTMNLIWALLHTH